MTIVAVPGSAARESSMDPPTDASTTVPLLVSVDGAYGSGAVGGCAYGGGEGLASAGGASIGCESVESGSNRIRSIHAVEFPAFRMFMRTESLPATNVSVSNAERDPSCTTRIAERSAPPTVKTTEAPVEDARNVDVYVAPAYAMMLRGGGEGRVKGQGAEERGGSRGRGRRRGGRA